MSLLSNLFSVLGSNGKFILSYVIPHYPSFLFCLDSVSTSTLVIFTLQEAGRCKDLNTHRIF